MVRMLPSGKFRTLPTILSGVGRRRKSEHLDRLAPAPDRVFKPFAKDGFRSQVLLHEKRRRRSFFQNL
jgi:hypothetical protein